MSYLTPCNRSDFEWHRLQHENIELRPTKDQWLRVFIDGEPIDVFYLNIADELCGACVGCAQLAAERERHA